MSSVEELSSERSSNGGGGAPVIEVMSPVTGKVIATVARLGPADVQQMAVRGRAAQPAWEAEGFAGRARIMRRMQKWMTENRDAICDTVISETGKSYEDAQLTEVSYTAAALGHWAKHAHEALADEKVPARGPLVLGKRISTRYVPFGLVGVIGPWNFPVVNSFGDTIPALMAGNSVILKPSEITPLSSLMIAAALRECGMPEDVFQVATGDGETGAALIDEVDMIMFTGSTATGRKVMARASQTLTPVSLELGGKDPMIVLADADIPKAAKAATFYSMLNAGQTCISIERAYVEAPVYDEFVERLTEHVAALRQGAPEGPGSVDVGALTTPEQLRIVERHVDDAIAKGARALCGGARGDGPGLFYKPTVLVDVDHTMQCMREETFGPTLPVMRVADADEAVRLANDSPYGLSAAVYTRDIPRGEEIARQIEAGAVCVNDAIVFYTALGASFGGMKSSGIGVRHGAAGIRKYARQQSILVNSRAMPGSEMHMYPYKKVVSQTIGAALAWLYGHGKRD